MTGSRCSTHRRRAPRTCAAPFRCRLVIMAKVPVAGRVKTRLARELGVATATRFARHATLAVLARMAHHPAWHTTVAIAPDNGIGWRIWPRHVDRVPQGHGGLGRRMQRIMQRTAPGPVVIIGTDVPGICTGPYSRRVPSARPARCRVRPGHRRRLLAGRTETASARAQNFRRRCGGRARMRWRTRSPICAAYRWRGWPFCRTSTRQKISRAAQPSPDAG